MKTVVTAVKTIISYHNSSFFETLILFYINDTYPFKRMGIVCSFNIPNLEPLNSGTQIVYSTKYFENNPDREAGAFSRHSGLVLYPQLPAGQKRSAGRD